MINDSNVPIKVLVVDDSAFMRRMISEIINSDPALSTIDVAKNGKEAIEKAILLKPDVVTLDVEMPVMDGLSCLKELVKVCDAQIIMLSSITKEGGEATIKALENGAIDFITKPTNIFEINSEIIKKELTDKIKVIAKLKKKKHIERNILSDQKSDYKKTSIKAVQTTKPMTAKSLKKIVAIGISTGGPKALRDMIPMIPGDIPAAFLIVQHMPEGFTKSLADRLNDISNIRVKEAEDNEVVKVGYAYIAPGNYHMRVSLMIDGNLKIMLSQDPPRGAHRPSATVMMESLSETGLANLVSIIMTGMGGDGSEGAKKIKQENNGYIIAQDEKTCVVYGMPKVTVEMGIVDEVVPLDKLSKKITEIVGV